MFKKKKGQGALEYLLLIGGAVLIAVIVIALLVSMGGQSRDTAQDQANKLQQATDTPQMAQIVSVVAKYEDCDFSNSKGTITLSWDSLGEGGNHKLKVLDSSNNELMFNGDPELTLNPNVSTVTVLVTGIGECGDSYYAKIITEKNNQSVESSTYRFSWVD